MNPFQEAANRANSEETPQQCASRWCQLAQDRLSEIHRLEAKLRISEDELHSAEGSLFEARKQVAGLVSALTKLAGLS